jgi:HD-GYP domain-containing protein (c-di-GMP phosphodiesterase class II)
MADAFRNHDPPSPPTSSAADSPEIAVRAVDELVQRLKDREEENLRLVDEVLQSYEQLNILFEVTRAFSELRNVDLIHDFALGRLSGPLRASFACILDGQGAFARTVGRFAEQPELVAHWRRLLSTEVEAALRAACTRGRVEIFRAAGHSLLVIPLLLGQEVRGAAMFARPDEEPFYTGDQSLAETVMGQVSQTAYNVELFNDLQEMCVDVVRAMVNAIDAKDSYTSGHSERVAQWSVLLGQELGWATQELLMLEWAGRLHDVGKIGIRDMVLGKPGALTAEEFEHIKQHPVISHEVLAPIRRLQPVLEGVRHHHEAWNGSGYPDGLAGEHIPLMARVIQTADVFDALTSSRSYRAAYTVTQALQVMREDAGRRLDPRMVEVCARVVARAQQESSPLLDHVPAEEEAAQATDTEGTP